MHSQTLEARLQENHVGNAYNAKQSYNDKYVIVYDFSKPGAYILSTVIPPRTSPSCLTPTAHDVAVKEFNTLLHDLEAAGLHTEVRPGYDQTILIFAKAPSQLLGNRVYKLRHVFFPL